MTVFDYKSLEQIDILKDVELFENIFDDPPKKQKEEERVKVNHEHPELVSVDLCLKDFK